MWMSDLARLFNHSAYDMDRWLTSPHPLLRSSTTGKLVTPIEAICIGGEDGEKKVMKLVDQLISGAYL